MGARICSGKFLLDFSSELEAKAFKKFVNEECPESNYDWNGIATSDIASYIECKYLDACNVDVYVNDELGFPIFHKLIDTINNGSNPLHTVETIEREDAPSSLVLTEEQLQIAGELLIDKPQPIKCSYKLSMINVNDEECDDLGEWWAFSTLDKCILKARDILNTDSYYTCGIISYTEDDGKSWETVDAVLWQDDCGKPYRVAWIENDSQCFDNKWFETFSAAKEYAQQKYKDGTVSAVLVGAFKSIYNNFIPLWHLGDADGYKLFKVYGYSDFTDETFLYDKNFDDIGKAKDYAVKLVRECYDVTGACVTPYDGDDIENSSLLDYSIYECKFDKKNLSLSKAELELIEGLVEVNKEYAEGDSLLDELRMCNSILQKIKLLKGEKNG